MLPAGNNVGGTEESGKLFHNPWMLFLRDTVELWTWVLQYIKNLPLSLSFALSVARSTLWMEGAGWVQNTEIP